MSSEVSNEFPFADMLVMHTFFETVTLLTKS